MAEESSPPDTLKLPQTDNSHLEEKLKSMIATECMKRFSTDVDFDKLPADQRAHVLLEIATTEASEEIRSFSLDRLSALLTEVIHTWSSEKLVPFNDEVIKSLQTVTKGSITEKMGDILVKVAVQSYCLNSDIQVYKSITNFVQSCVRNESSSQKKVALSIIKRVPNLFGIANVSDLKNVFERALNDADSAIRIAAAQTFFSVVHKDTITVLSPLLSYIIQICAEFVTGDSVQSSFCPLGPLFNLSSAHDRALFPHLKAIIRLCSLATPELAVDKREVLTVILHRAIRGRDNDDIDADLCAKIAHFIVNYASVRDKDVATLAMQVVSDVPHGFKDATAVLHLFSTRLAADYSVLRIESLHAMMRLLMTHDDPKYHSILLPPLLPQILKLCTDQIQSENDHDFPFCTPMNCLSQIAVINAKLLESIVLPIVALSSKILRKASSEKGQPLSESTIIEMRQVLDILKGVLSDCKSTAPNGDPEKEMISELCQQLSKARLFISFYAAYSENFTTMRNEIMDIIRRVARFLGALEIAGAWSVHNEMMKNPTSDHNMTVTLHIIGKAPAFSTCPVTASSFFTLCLIHPVKSIKSLALETFAGHCHMLKLKKREELLKKLSHLVPHILMLAYNNSSLRIDARNCLCKLLARSSDVLQPHLTQFVHFLCQMIGDSSTGVYWRQQFAHFITHLTRKFREKFALADKIDPSTIPLIFSSCISTMTELDENIDGWEALDEYLIGNEQRLVDEDNFLQLVFYFKAKGAGKTLLQITTPMLNHVNWRQRNAGVIGLAAIGCVATAEIVPEVLKRIISLLRDTNNRVRSAACFALTRFFAYCPPNLLEKSQSIVIPALLHTLEDTRVPRVTAAAAAALAACCKIYPKPALRDHLPALMNSAVIVIKETYRTLLTDGKTCILAQLISLISSMKDVESSPSALLHRSLYAEYYKQLIGPLKAILTDNKTNRCPVLDASSLECVSLISLAVGENKCMKDCTEMMNSLIPRLDSILLLWDGDFSSTFGRMASSMGNSFLPFLHPLMEPIINAIRTGPAELDDNGCVVPVYGDNPIRRRKRGACGISTKLATAVGAAFLPFACEMTALALDHLQKARYTTIYINSRPWSVEIIPALLECYAKGGDMDAAAKLWVNYARSFEELIEEEQWEGMIIPSIARCVASIASMTEDVRLYIGRCLEKERDYLRKKRQDREESNKIHIEYEEQRGFAKDDDRMEETIATLESNLMRFV